MVTRINGSVRQGVFFSKDVKFVQLTATGTTYLSDLVDDTDVAVTPGVGSTQRIAAVGSDLEIAVEKVATEVQNSVAALKSYAETETPSLGQAIGSLACPILLILKLENVVVVFQWDNDN